MRTAVLTLTSLLAIVVVMMFGACGVQEQVYVPVCPDGGIPGNEWCPPDAVPDAGDAGDASDGGEEGGMSFCPGQCVTPPSDDWSDPRLLWVGPESQAPDKCPPQAPNVAYIGHFSLHAEPLQCDPCACDPPSGSCSPPETFTAHTAICQDIDQWTLDTPFDPPAMWDGTCTPDNGIDAGAECPLGSGVLCVQSVTVGKMVMTESACQPSFQPPKLLTPPAWDVYGLACKGEIPVPSAYCADPAKKCVPTAEPPPPGYLQCVYQDGDIQSCPTDFPLRTLLYRDYDDTRHCTVCGCGDPQGSLCKGMATVYEDPACTVPIRSDTTTSQFSPCGDVPPGIPLGSKTVTGLQYTAGSCEATGGEPMGDAIPVEPRTFCCMT